MRSHALDAIAEDDDDAAAGVHVTVEKLKITVLSAMMTACASSTVRPVLQATAARTALDMPSR